MPLIASAQGTGDELNNEEIIELSPFVVSASEDVGYIATSTLAGTRMRMSLADVGSAVSVYTEELMNDLQATDNETLLAYGLGTEVGGTRGNFVNPNTEGLENENLLNPQSNNRIRGLTSADSTRNYFKSDVPWDGYNTYRIDVQRGPNSVLFGLGSPAGLINSSTDMAMFADFNQVQVRYDEFDSLRMSATFNKEIIEDELAVRVNLLRDDQKFRQHPTFEEDERIYAAMTWDPAVLNKGSTRTSFTVSYEAGDGEANRPRMVVPNDYVSPFFYSTTESGFQGADFQNGGKFGPAATLVGPGGQTYHDVNDDALLDQMGWVTRQASPWVIFAFDATNPNAGFTVSEASLNSKGSFFVLDDPNSDEVTVLRNNAAYLDPYSGNFVRGAQDNIFVLRHMATQGKRRVADDNGLAFSGFWRDESFSSTDQFDYVNNLIDGNNKLEQQDFDVLELNLRNTFLNDLFGYQLSFFKQDLTFRQDSNLGNIYAPAIQVAVNETDPLATDSSNPGTNPYAGRAYIDFELRLSGGTEDIREREASQAQVFARLDLPKYIDHEFWGNLLGTHDLIGLFKNQQLERYRREFRSTGVDEATVRAFGGAFPDNPDLNPDYRPINDDPGPGARMTELFNAFGSVEPRIRVYLESTGPNLTGLQPFGDPFVPSGRYPVRGFVADPNPGFDATAAAVPWTEPDADETYQANNPVNYAGVTENKGMIGVVKATDSTEALEYLTSRRFYDKEDIDSKSFVWSGSFLSRSIVGMYGWRRDDVDQIALEHDYSRSEEVNDTGRTGGPQFDPNSPYARQTKGSFESSNWSVKVDPFSLSTELFKLNTEWMPLDLAVFYSEGEVQNPQPGRRDILLNDLAPTTGTTEDLSFAIGTKDGRYTLRLTKYKTVQSNANAGSVAASDNWRIEQIFAGWGGLAQAIQMDSGTNSSYAQGVFNNGDDVTDPFEWNPTRTQQLKDRGYTSIQDYVTTASQAYFDMVETLFTQWPATQSWITSPGGLEDINKSTLDVLFPDDTVFIEDNESKGWELEFVARPMANWDIIINLSKTEVLRSKVFTDEVNEVIDFVVERINGPAGDVPMWWNEGPFVRDWLAPFTGQLVTNRALLGTPTGELRKWKGNLVTNYSFTEGALTGFSIGGGVRYEGSQVIGFRTIYVNPETREEITGDEIPNDAAVSVDLDSPYEDEDRWTFDLWLKYDIKLPKSWDLMQNVDWSIQLNVFNVFDDKGTVPLFINPDGTIGTRGIREGRSWAITSTFDF